jgi:hypothetical protein
VKLFNRSIELIVAKPATFFTQDPNAVVVRDLRVVFKIEKTLGDEPNQASVVVYNASEETRSFLQQKPRHVRVSAGYDGELAQIFSGDLFWGASRKDGVDWITTLQLSDGHRAFNYGRVNRSFRPGTDGRQLLREVAASMDLKVPRNMEEAQELLGEFSGGAVMHGPARRELTKLLRPKGLTWSVQDGSLQILRETEVRSDEAVLVSEDTGMIESPEQGPPDRSGGKPPVTTVRMLLHPRIQPGVKLKIESRSVSGLFKTQRVSHEGDLFGKFETTAEAVAL